jgi:uncharacterized membrane protein YhhN
VVTCAFDASQFKVAVVFGVPVSLAVCTLGTMFLVSGRFKFYFVSLYTFDIENICYLGQVAVKNMESGSLFLYCLMFQIFVTECPNFSISTLMSSGLME